MRGPAALNAELDALNEELDALNEELDARDVGLPTAPLAASTFRASASTTIGCEHSANNVVTISATPRDVPNPGPSAIASLPSHTFRKPGSPATDRQPCSSSVASGIVKYDGSMEATVGRISLGTAT
jgi:hypothetical protein